MNALTKILSISLCLMFSAAIAQDFQGIATYKSKRQMDIKLDSTKGSPEMHQKMVEAMKKQFEKTFVLTFNKSESLFKQEETLGKPQVGMGSGVNVMMIGDGGGGDIYYKNTKDNRYVNQADTFGKIFLVRDSLKQRTWVLRPETKHIGEYLCHKATILEEYESTEMKFNGMENKDLEPETSIKQRTITAWYTLDIPVNNGPRDYQGLPGLILEVDNGHESLICSRIVLNPEKKVEIIEPVKGKKVNQEEYDKIMEKKSKEMMERFRPKRGAKNGDQIEIRIQG